MHDLRPEIRTLVSPEDGTPRVVLAIIDDTSGRVVLPISFNPEEARTTAHLLMEAAESIEQDAHLIAALRAQKYDEEDIGDIVTEVRFMRQTDMNSVTLEESQEGGDTD